MHLKYFAALLCIIGVSACGGDSDKLAEVGGKTITNKQFESFLEFKRIPAEDGTRREKALDEYLQREALAGVIEKEDLLDADMVAAELNEFRKEMIISRYFETFLKDKVTDTAVQNYYNTHAGDYEEKKVHAAHILIRTNSKMSETERKVKLTTAQEAYSKIKAGQDFAEIAKDYSEDKVSAKKGGDLGWLKQGSIDERFSKTLFELEPGQVSEPFETPFGFHIIKVLEGAKVIKRPFEAVAGDIRYQLRGQAKQAEMERLTGMVVVERE
jgi:peptidyl-prolyl cis-trans isomerase C